MVISIFGSTEKRPVIYTILKMFTVLGQDSLFITDDLRYRRLFSKEESSDIADNSGYFENNLIIITDVTPDEAAAEFQYRVDDYDNVVYCNKVDTESDLIIYVGGAAMTEEEEELVDYIQDEIRINLGFGKGAIPYTVNMFKNLELFEAHKHAVEIDSNVTVKVAGLLAEPMGMPAKTIVKAVKSK
jgi:hypothetical protein